MGLEWAEVAEDSEHRESADKSTALIADDELVEQSGQHATAEEAVRSALEQSLADAGSGLSICSGPSKTTKNTITKACVGSIQDERGIHDPRRPTQTAPVRPPLPSKRRGLCCPARESRPGRMPPNLTAGGGRTTLRHFHGGLTENLTFSICGGIVQTAQSAASHVLFAPFGVPSIFDSLHSFLLERTGSCRLFEIGAEVSPSLSCWW